MLLVFVAGFFAGYIVIPTRNVMWGAIFGGVFVLIYMGVITLGFEPGALWPF